MSQILTILISVFLSVISTGKTTDNAGLQAKLETIDCNTQMTQLALKPEFVANSVELESAIRLSKTVSVKQIDKIDLNIGDGDDITTRDSQSMSSESLNELFDEKRLIEIEEPEIQKANHSQFDNLLKRFVSDHGIVDYAGLKKSEAELDRYLDYLNTNPAASLSKADKLAFWINTYNAFTLKLIVSNYPIASITDLEGGKPWDKKWINIGDRTYSLNQIENKIIRPKFNDARIHFAVNCAAKSCPPLANKAFTATNLESLLERRTKAFINNPKYTKVSGRTISVSKIFEWYAEDFGNIRDYIAKYYDGALPKANIDFMEYDWSLNER